VRRLRRADLEAVRVCLLDMFWGRTMRKPLGGEILNQFDGFTGHKTQEPMRRCSKLFGGLLRWYQIMLLALASEGAKRALRRKGHSDTLIQCVTSIPPLIMSLPLQILLE
jgi:hypothetical protein